jgi:uncharacterized membrane protein YczE
MKKKVLYSEFAYLAGLILLALGTAMMEKADFGVSMVVAPAYLIYRKLNPVLSFVSFGMAEYMLQLAVLIVMMLILRRIRLSYILSFATAVIYGFILDGSMALAGMIAANPMWLRIVFYLLGMLVCSMGVSMLFHTYIAPEAYELFVKEVSARMKMDIHRFKTVYDCVSCLIAVVMSFAFFGFGVFEGVKLGTVLCALVNGSLIGVCSRFYERKFVFRDGLPYRRFFET